jgi:hypothetical protein
MQYQGQENLNLYIHSPICLHDIVLNQLSTGTALQCVVHHVRGIIFQEESSMLSMEAKISKHCGVCLSAFV